MQFIDLGAQRERLGDRLKAAIDRVVDGGQLYPRARGRRVRSTSSPPMSASSMSSPAPTAPTRCCCRSMPPASDRATRCSCRASPSPRRPRSWRWPRPSRCSSTSIPTPTISTSPASKRRSPWSRREGRLKPRAIIPVDLFGLAADYAAIDAIAEREGLLVIEDAAQSIGGTVGERMCGAFGARRRHQLLSGQAARLLRRRRRHVHRRRRAGGKAALLAFHGKGETQYDNIHVGLNSRLDTLQAAILIEKLAILEEEMVARQAVAKRYADGARRRRQGAGRPARAAARPGRNMRSRRPHRDGLKAHLQDDGIPTVIYYVKPLHQQVAYAHFPRTPGGLPVSEALPERDPLPADAPLSDGRRPGPDHRRDPQLRRTASRGAAEPPSSGRLRPAVRGGVLPRAMKYGLAKSSATGAPRLP